MQVKATKVIKWVDNNLPPLSWRIIAMKLMKVLVNNKVFPAKIDDTTYFNDNIMSAIKEMVKKDYGKDLPDQF